MTPYASAGGWLQRWLALLLAALLLLAPAGAPAKTLIVNANGYGLDLQGRLTRFAMLLVADDGRVMALLPKGASEPKLEARDYRLDAGGRTLIPGLIDPHGHVMVYALAAIGKSEGEPVSHGDRERALENGLQKLASLGLTGVHDMGISAADWALYRSFGDNGRLSVRITAYAGDMAAMEAISPLRPTPWLYDDRLRLAGIHLRADTMLAAKEARMKNLFSRANYLGYQVAVDASGAEALTRVLDSFAEILPAYGDGFRNRIESCDLLAQPAAVARLTELGLVATLLPGDGGNLAGWRQLPAAAVVLGSDFPRTPANPFVRLHAAVSADAGTTLAQALAAFTSGVAFAAGTERRVGALAVGQHADFLLLDRDPFVRPLAELPDVQVQETWLAGRRVWQRQP